MNGRLAMPIRVLAIIALVASALPASADPWPHWRGPARNDHSAEDSGYERGAWPPDKQLWEGNFGQGTTSPVVDQGRLYTMGWQDGRDRVIAVDARTGKELWSQQYPCPRYGRNAEGDQGFYAGPCSTPELDPDTGLLYTLSIDGDLNCWDTGRDGARVWGFNLHERFDPPKRPRVGRSGRRDYGYTSSPLVQDNALIVEVGAAAGNLMAFDKRSGRQLWTSQNRDPAGHNGGPVPIEVEGVPCVAVLNHFHLLVARIDAGKAGQTVAEFPWETSFANNIASPAVHQDTVLITSEYNQRAICKLKITLQGAQELWKAPYASKVCSPVVHAGHVYWAWRDLYCLDFQTGELVWQAPIRISDAGSCILTVDQRLIIWGANGRLLLADTAQRSPGEGRILAEKSNLARVDCWPHVVLSGGLLYCKDKQGNLRCLDLRGQ